jgi:hypothetical protein
MDNPEVPTDNGYMQLFSMFILVLGTLAHLASYFGWYTENEMLIFPLHVGLMILVPVAVFKSKSRGNVPAIVNSFPEKQKGLMKLAFAYLVFIFILCIYLNNFGSPVEEFAADNPTERWYRLIARGGRTIRTLSLEEFQVAQSRVFRVFSSFWAVGGLFTFLTFKNRKNEQFS